VISIFHQLTGQGSVDVGGGERLSENAQAQLTGFFKSHAKEHHLECIVSLAFQQYQGDIFHVCRPPFSISAEAASALEGASGSPVYVFSRSKNNFDIIGVMKGYGFFNSSSDLQFMIGW
jgi:hypothetical protein